MIICGQGVMPWPQFYCRARADQQLLIQGEFDG
jgi:hypothetical protein